MRLIIAISVAILSLSVHCTSESSNRKGSQPITHESWSRLLKKYVAHNGDVDYHGFIRDSSDLNVYLDKLASHPPDEENWTEKERLAYWINAYNAFTIKLIIDHYPLQSIKDIGSSIQIPFINSPWDIKFIEINGEKLDLNDIEHSILRKKFDEPRIHFAINCASRSCPKLRREAYVAQKLEAQLTEQTIEFINDPSRNHITGQQAELSKIFSWFKGDFTKKHTLKEFINQYANAKLNEETSISFMNYDWSLNEKQ